jgi:hypothetical protein
MYSDITLLLLAYYIGVSIATEVLAVDYKGVIIRWWNKPFKKSRRSKNLKKKRKSTWKWKSKTRYHKASETCHKQEICYPVIGRARYGSTRGKSKYKGWYYYIYKLMRSRGTTGRCQVARLTYCCTNSTCTPRESFDTDNNSTETYDSDSHWIGIDSLSTYCITNSMQDFHG